MMKVLGTPNITPELEANDHRWRHARSGRSSVEQLASEENEVLVGLLKLRANHENSASAMQAGPTRKVAELKLK